MSKPTIGLGCDHAGFEYKELIKKMLLDGDFTIHDFGTFSPDPVDYPDFVHPLAEAVERKEYELGILICGSANGVAITANKHSGIRAAIAWKDEVASLARRHNNANVLCIPARFVSSDEARQFVTTFLNTSFEGGRHILRVNKRALSS
jgi:ribose 5-phosphate isomerase B